MDGQGLDNEAQRRRIGLGAILERQSATTARAPRAAGFMMLWMVLENVPYFSLASPAGGHPSADLERSSMSESFLSRSANTTKDRTPAPECSVVGQNLIAAAARCRSSGRGAVIARRPTRVDVAARMNAPFLGEAAAELGVMQGIEQATMPIGIQQLSPLRHRPCDRALLGVETDDEARVHEDPGP